MYRIVVLFLLLLIAGLVLVIGRSEAQYNPCRVRVHTPAVHHVPYVAPTHHSYGHNYSHHKEVVLKAVKVPVYPDYYYSVSDGYRDALLADAVAWRVLLAQKLGGQTPSPSGPRYREPLPPAPAPAPAAPPAGKVGQAGDIPRMAPADGALQQVVAVVERHCIKCHAGANGIDLTDLARVPAGQRWHAYALANSGEMPRGGKAIADDEVRLLYNWAKSGGASK